MSIILDHVNHIYGKKTAYERVALKDISLKIEPGEFIGIIGRTGSGKSTLIQHLNGLLKADSGKIYFHGKDIYDEDFNMKALRGRVGLVFQYPEHQLFETNVYDDVAFGPKNQGLKGLDLEMKVYESLKLVGIGDDLIDVSPLELSGGQKRRVAIAGVIAMDPEVLILDEPCAGLDPKGREEILGLIGNLRKEKNMTIILVSHSMEDVAEYTDRIIVMNEGQVVFDDTKEKVFAHYKELEEMGLAATTAIYAVMKLREMGYPIKETPITIHEASKAILRDVYGL